MSSIPPSVKPKIILNRLDVTEKDCPVIVADPTAEGASPQLTELQKDILSSTFELDPFHDEGGCANIAESLCMKEVEVKRWFVGQRKVRLSTETVKQMSKDSEIVKRMTLNREIVKRMIKDQVTDSHTDNTGIEEFADRLDDAGIMFQCKICKYTVKYPSNMWRHLNRQHGIEQTKHSDKKSKVHHSGDTQSPSISRKPSVVSAKIPARKLPAKSLLKRIAQESPVGSPSRKRLTNNSLQNMEVIDIEEINTKPKELDTKPKEPVKAEEKVGFPCGVCGKVIKYERNLQHHMKTKHESKKAPKTVNSTASMFKVKTSVKGKVEKDQAERKPTQSISQTFGKIRNSGEKNNKDLISAFVNNSLKTYSDFSDSDSSDSDLVVEYSDVSRVFSCGWCQKEFKQKMLIVQHLQQHGGGSYAFF